MVRKSYILVVLAMACGSSLLGMERCPRGRNNPSMAEANPHLAGRHLNRREKKRRAQLKKKKAAADAVPGSAVARVEAKLASPGSKRAVAASSSAKVLMSDVSPTPSPTPSLTVTTFPLVASRSPSFGPANTPAHNSESSSQGASEIIFPYIPCSQFRNASPRLSDTEIGAADRRASQELKMDQEKYPYDDLDDRF